MNDRARSGVSAGPRVRRREASLRERVVFDAADAAGVDRAEIEPTSRATSTPANRRRIGDVGVGPDRPVVGRPGARVARRAGPGKPRRVTAAFHASEPAQSDSLSQRADSLFHSGRSSVVFRERRPHTASGRVYFLLLCPGRVIGHRSYPAAGSLDSVSPDSRGRVKLVRDS